MPARNALVERRNLAAAISVNAATYQGTIFIGAAIGGGIVVVAGSGATFLIYGCGIAFAFFMVAILDIAPHTRKAGPRDSFFAELGAGFRYAFAHSGIRVMLFLSALMALAVQPYQEMLSGFAAICSAAALASIRCCFQPAGWAPCWAGYGSPGAGAPRASAG